MMIPQPRTKLLKAKSQRFSTCPEPPGGEAGYAKKPGSDEEVENPLVLFREDVYEQWLVGNHQS